MATSLKDRVLNAARTTTPQIRESAFGYVGESSKSTQVFDWDALILDGTRVIYKGIYIDFPKGTNVESELATKLAAYIQANGTEEFKAIGVSKNGKLYVR